MTKSAGLVAFVIITYPDDCLDIDVKMIEFDSIVKMRSADSLTRAPRRAMRASLQDGEAPSPSPVRSIHQLCSARQSDARHGRYIFILTSTLKLHHFAHTTRGGTIARMGRNV
jgi:hypothetical protein